MDYEEQAIGEIGCLRDTDCTRERAGILQSRTSAESPQAIVGSDQ